MLVVHSADDDAVFFEIRAMALEAWCFNYVLGNTNSLAIIATFWWSYRIVKLFCFYSRRLRIVTVDFFMDWAGYTIWYNRSLVLRLCNRLLFLVCIDLFRFNLQACQLLRSNLLMVLRDCRLGASGFKQAIFTSLWSFTNTKLKFLLKATSMEENIR